MKLIFSLLSFFIYLNLYSQNGLNNGDLFILPNAKNKISVNRFENETIKELKTISINKKSIYSTDQKNIVVILNPSKKSILFYNIKTSKKQRISIPYDIKPKSLLIDDNNLFIGGEMENEMLVQYNLKNQKWFSLEIPEEIKYPGKSIDDIVINDEYLIAIDNIVIPKYILFYKLNSTDKLVFSHQKELKFNSSYESTHLARIHDNYLGLYSTTLNWGTFSEHITIYKNLDLKVSFAISSQYNYKGNINDILLVNNNLYIANRNKGLGKLLIQDTLFNLQNNYEWEETNPEIEESLVEYETFNNQEPIKLTKIPNQNKFIITLQDQKGNYRKIIR